MAKNPVATTASSMLPILALVVIGTVSRVTATGGPTRRSHAIMGAQRGRDLQQSEDMDIVSDLLSENVVEMDRLMLERLAGHQRDRQPRPRTAAASAAAASGPAAPFFPVPERPAGPKPKPKTTVLDLLVNIFLFNGVDANDPHTYVDAAQPPRGPVASFATQLLDVAMRVVLFNGVDYTEKVDHKEEWDPLNQRPAAFAQANGSSRADSAQPPPPPSRGPATSLVKQLLDVFIRVVLFNGVDYKEKWDPLDLRPTNLAQLNGSNPEPMDTDYDQHLPQVMIRWREKVSRFFSMGLSSAGGGGVMPVIVIAFGASCLFGILVGCCGLCSGASDTEDRKAAGAEDDELHEVWVRKAQEDQPLGSLLHGDPDRRLAQKSAALNLRGGGPFDCGYGACSGSKARDVNAEPTMYENLSKGGSLWQLPADKRKLERAREEATWTKPPKQPGIFVRIHDFFENPIVAFGLITIDLTCTIVSMFASIGWLSYVSLAILGIMLLQQLLDIIMVACPVTHYLIDGQCVYATEQFLADNGGEPLTIEQGFEGQVDMVTKAAWRENEYGAYVKFTNVDSSKCFVPESEWEHLQVEFSLITYFTNPINFFNIALLVFCLWMAFHSSAGFTGILIVLRFLKPVLKIQGRIKKVREFYEKSGVGEAEEAEEAVLAGSAIVEAEKINP